MGVPAGGLAMNWVIAYDITSDRQRARVAAILSAFGDRTQKSVFECSLDPEELAAVLANVRDKVDVSGDSVRAYRQCTACDEASHSIGQASARTTQPYWIV